MLQVLCGDLVCYILEFILQLLYLYHWIYNYSYILLDLCVALGDGFYVHIIMLNVKFVWFALPLCFLFNFLGAFETNTCVFYFLFSSCSVVGYCQFCLRPFFFFGIASHVPYFNIRWKLLFVIWYVSFGYFLLRSLMLLFLQECNIY